MGKPFYKVYKTQKTISPKWVPIQYNFRGIRYGTETAISDDTFLSTAIIVDIKLPSILIKLAKYDPTVVNLLQLAVIEFNEELEKNGTNGYGRIVIMGQEMIEYNIKYLSFDSAVDFDNLKCQAELETKNSSKIRNLVEGGSLSFYISGKFVLESRRKVSKVIFTKVINQYDQTAIAKMMQETEMERMKEVMEAKLLTSVSKEGGNTEKLKELVKEEVEKEIKKPMDMKKMQRLWDRMKPVKFKLTA